MTDLLRELRQVPEFKDLPETQLEWLIEKGTVMAYADGDHVFRRGAPIEQMRILLKGEVNFYIEQGGNLRHMGTFETHEITGQLPFSRMKGAVGTGIVKGETIMYSLHKDHFPEMIRNHYELVEVLVHIMTDRVRDFTKQQQQDEKLMALGKLSAGLAHELNNPSAAIVRSAHELKRHLTNIPENFKRIINIKATEGIVDEITNHLFSWIQKGNMVTPSLSQRTALEDAILEWFQENELDAGDDMAETFTAFGVGAEELEKIKSLLNPVDKKAVFGWLHQMLTTEQLVSEIEEAAKRINTLVTSVKGYTHMDQTPEKELTDIHTGIRNTLAMLNHKMKKQHVTLIENYLPELPLVKVFASALNQVWTNLIDNAIDAMEGRKNNTLEIRTERENKNVIVSIIDNGPGIPPELIDKIFDPFFTTKAIGKGTGLGLEVARQIINQHKGGIDVQSSDKGTSFRVCFPINSN
jgi:signal transduction histidine kinase